MKKISRRCGMPWPGALVVALVMALLGMAGFALAQEARSRIAAPPENSVVLLPDRVVPPPQCDCPVQLTRYDIKTSIKDNVATTTITQEFKNDSGRTLEARYLFPLPPDANFSSFTLTVNGKALEGQILEKDQARQTYQEIVRKLIDPGLLEYIDDKTVQVSVAPFFAGETKKIQLSYTQLLKQDGGLYKYTYYLGNPAPGTINRPMPVPMTREDSTRHSNEVAAPRPVPAPGMPEIGLALDLKTTQALKTVYSPTHDPAIDRHGNNAANVSLTVKKADLGKEKNFVLYFSEDNGAITLNSLNYQKGGEDGYFLMTLRAPASLQDQPVLPKDVVLVIDTSGSMGGDKIVQAKEALKTIINKLRPEDNFGLLQFNTDVATFKNELIPANAANKKAALDYVEGLDAGGSTNIEAALNTGFAQLKNHQANRPAYVIFLTDGEPTVGVTDTVGLLKAASAANRVEARLFNFGVGYDVKTDLLDQLADAHHGSATYVEPNENLELAVTGFYNKIEAPVLTDVALDWGGLEVSRVYPEKIGDLFAGSEIILLGRHAHAGSGTVKLTGKVGNQVKSFAYPVSWEPGTSHSQLPRLWAGRRIGYLLENIRQHGENSELKSEVVSLSKQYGIITPYTSFLALEPQFQASAAEKKDGRADSAMRPGLAGAGGSGGFPAAAPVAANQAAMDATSGQGAVQFSKTLGRMKQQASIRDLEASQAVGSVEGAAASLKTVANKTFTLSRDGVWIDTQYDAKQHGKPKQVSFGTDAYFDLLAQKPELLPYFGLGEKVLVVLDGVAYEVVAAQAG